MRVRITSSISGSLYLFRESFLQGLCIDKEGGALLIPILLEFAGQHFCLIDWEEERAFCGSSGVHSGGFPRRNVLRSIVCGKLAPDWPSVPLVDWCFVTSRNQSKKMDIPWLELSAVLRSRSLRRADENVLCLGDEECSQLVRETLGYDHQVPVHIEPHVWVDVFCAMPSESARALMMPEAVVEASSRCLHEINNKVAELTEKRHSLQSQMAALSDEIEKLTQQSERLSRLRM